MDKQELNSILSTATTISDIAFTIFGNKYYNTRERCKKILFENGINWEEWLETKKKQPNICLNCGKELTGKYRFIYKFCNHSCAATYNNTKRGINKCLNCGKEIKSKKFCSHECKLEYKYKTLIDDWKNGKIKGCCSDGSIKTFVKHYLLEKHNYQCEICGYDKVNEFTNSPILQVHHIDGDCFNDKEDNLKLLCPNCHALTENYGSRNKNSTRIDRRTKYYNKKD